MQILIELGMDPCSHVRQFDKTRSNAEVNKSCFIFLFKLYSNFYKNRYKFKKLVPLYS